MNTAELILVNQGDGCTIYTIQFLSENKSEFERFYHKFKNDAEYNPDLMRIVALINKISDVGSLERYFRPEGKFNDSVCALPTSQSKLRLYCLRLSDRILIIGNGGIKNTRTYNEDNSLKGYVINLQNFEKLIKEEEKNGAIRISANTIETTLNFDI